MQVGFSDAQGADQATQLLHLTNLLHIAVAVADLVDDLVLLRHQLELISHVVDRPVELWHVLVQVEREERRLEHRLAEHLMRLEVELGALIGVLHHFERQLLDFFSLGVDALVVEEFAQGVEDR